MVQAAPQSHHALAKWRLRSGSFVLAYALMSSVGVAHAKPLADAVIRMEAGSERERRAADRYETGAAAFQKKDYRTAVRNFLAADELWPSAALSYNIGLAYDHLGDTTRALSYYRQYLARRPEGESNELVAQRIRELELLLMRKGVQQLTVRSEPSGASLTIEGRPVGVTPWTGELRPGEYRLALTLSDGRTGSRKVLLPAANAVDVLVPLARVEATKATVPAVADARSAPDLRLEAASRADAGAAHDAGTSQASGSPWPWITLGGGVVFLGASGTFELLRRQAKSEADSALTEAQYQDRREQVDTYRTTSLLLLGGGGALLVTSGVLFLLDSGEDARTTSGMFGCSDHGCYGAYSGRF